MKRVPDLRFSVSYTTRPPRGQERDGQEYYFISREEFEAARRQGRVSGIGRGVRQLLRHASSASWTGPRREGVDLVLDIDVQGARQLKERIPAAVSIFILAPSRQILEQRLRARSQDSEPVIERRLREAAEEIRNYTHYDYVLVNREVEASVDTLVSIVQGHAEPARPDGREIRPILETFEDMA